MSYRLPDNPIGTDELRKLLESGAVPVTIGDKNGPWYTIRASRPSLNGRDDSADLTVQFPDGGIGERHEVPVDQDVEVFE